MLFFAVALRVPAANARLQAHPLLRHTFFITTNRSVHIIIIVLRLKSKMHNANKKSKYCRGGLASKSRGEYAYFMLTIYEYIARLPSELRRSSCNGWAYGGGWWKIWVHVPIKSYRRVFNFIYYKFASNDFTHQGTATSASFNRRFFHCEILVFDSSYNDRTPWYPIIKLH